jgi:anti-sigma factor RsiW
MISAWLDNELSPAEVNELQAHLADCAACRHTYQAMQQIDNLFHHASAVMVAPQVEFSQRIEARLARRQQEQWRLWLGLGILLLGTMFVVSFGALIIGVTLLDAGSVFDVALLYRGLAEFIESVQVVSGLLSLASLLLKACVITMSQPLFWIAILVAAVMAWLWIRGLRSFFRQPPAAVELLI